MNDYQPQPGETVLLTVTAVMCDSGQYAVVDDRGREVWRTSTGNSYEVRVEPLPKPALPTAFGSRITATAGAVRMELVRVHDDPVPSPWMTRSGVPYGSSELSDVEVLHDPDRAGRDVPVEAAEPEPAKLPTGLGAVVKFRLRASSAVYLATLGGDEDSEPWRVYGGGWLTSRQVEQLYTLLAVLSPGVEVDLP